MRSISRSGTSLSVRPFATALASLFIALPASAQEPAAAASPAEPAPTPAASSTPAPAPSRDEGAGETEKPVEDTERRHELLHAQSTLQGSTGLIRVQSADSGAAGTFRVSMAGSYFSGSGFLCGECTDAAGVGLTGKDDVSQIGTNLRLSATPFRFLEGFAAMKFASTSNNRGNPQVMQVVGDTTLGAKGFWPFEADRIYSFGGSLAVDMLNGAGGNGVEAANAALNALATLDFSNRTAADKRIPLRAHLNAGYLFDNSGKIADKIEREREGVLNRPTRITKAERFGHGINRTDSFQLGIGAEGTFEYVRPFAEWTVAVPVNRQNHTCVQLYRAAGDTCLADAKGFDVTRSRVSLGVRAYPWVTDWLEGLSILAAADIGTSGTRHFIEENAPERPWTVHVGLAYAYDTHKPVKVEREVVEKVVRLPPPPERHVEGTVVDSKTGNPIAGAAVRFKTAELSGLLSDADGRFVTGNLDPGPYTFSVSAEGYREGECTADVPKEAEPASNEPEPGIDPGPGAPSVYRRANRRALLLAKGGDEDGPPLPSSHPSSKPKLSVSGSASASTQTGVSAEGAASTEGGAPADQADVTPLRPEKIVVQVRCELEPLPKVGTVNGVLRDATTTVPIVGAAVTITDEKGRTLTLSSNEAGEFRFENVPAGSATIAVEAEGYLRSVSEFPVEPRETVQARMMLHERPKKANVVVTDKEVKLKEKVHFLHGSAELLPDSMALIEEIAEALRDHPEIQKVEIQGHTDDTGTPEYNLELSEKRAEAVRDALITNGIDPSRLVAKGYGQEKPVATNASEWGRSRNRRVQLIILERSEQ